MKETTRPSGDDGTGERCRVYKNYYYCTHNYNYSTVLRRQVGDDNGASEGVSERWSGPGLDSSAGCVSVREGKGKGCDIQVADDDDAKYVGSVLTRLLAARQYANRCDVQWRTMMA